MRWYQQFWPWFIITFPAIAVVAGIATIIIATLDPDGLVVADYYRQGLAINRNIAQRQASEALGLAAELHLDHQGSQVVLNLINDQTDATLSLQLIHPTRIGRDRSTVLVKAKSGHYIGSLSLPQAGRWRIVVTATDRPWRLVGQVTLSAQDNTLNLQPG